MRAGVAALGLAAAAAILPASASAGTFAVLSYNVHGLPPPVIADRSAEMAAIAPLLEDFHTSAPPYAGISSVVGLQEVFRQSYYDTLTDAQTVTYPYITVKDDGGLTHLGDGLNLLSDFALQDFSRTQWDDCAGTLDQNNDCLTNKGFTYAKVVLEDNVSFDLYTLHADAGQDSESRDARRKNITQLVEAINTLSPEGTAVIVLGDTNSLYTRVGTDNIQDLVLGTGVKDVWVQLLRGGIAPEAGSRIDSDCDTNPSTANCELFDKVFFRDGDRLVFAPQSYEALKEMFSEDGKDLSDHYPVAVRFEYAVLGTTTTTTTPSSTSSTSTSTTTTEYGRPCGDPIADASVALAADLRAVVAGDALLVLKAAVGTRKCALCTCDVNNNGSITAPDALRVLKAAVGQPVSLNCPPCPPPPTTTTTIPPP